MTKKAFGAILTLFLLLPCSFGSVLAEESSVPEGTTREQPAEGNLTNTEGSHYLHYSELDVAEQAAESREMIEKTGIGIPEEIREQLAAAVTPFEIPDAIQGQLTCAPQDEVFVMYFAPPYRCLLGKGLSIEEILFSGDWIIYPSYLAIQQGFDSMDHRSYLIYQQYIFNRKYPDGSQHNPKEGQYFSLLDDNFYQYAYQYLKDPSAVLQKIGKDAQIEKTYVLYEGDCACAIYYVTNQGDYVLYKERPDSKTEYFFPKDDFCAFCKSVYEYYDQAYDQSREAQRQLQNKTNQSDAVADIQSGAGRSDPIADIKAYEFHPEKSNRWVLPTAIAAGTGTLGACAIVLLKKRKRKT